MTRSQTERENVTSSRKRKADSQIPVGIEELEIDLDAPEPASRKVLRRAKRSKLSPDPEHGRRVGKAITATNRNELGGKSTYGIWIGNLPFFVTKQELRNFLADDSDCPVPLEEIVRIHLPRIASKGASSFQNKGFAYVDFETKVAQQNAIRLSEKALGGRRVLIKGSKDFEGRPELPKNQREVDRKKPSKRIFVGNLGFDVTREDLESHFEQLGSITTIHMATFEDSGKCKGYAWVEFERLASAEAAIRGWTEIEDKVVVSNRDTKPSRRRLWFNKMKGRKMRMEFAEDPTSRYNKRFGKHPIAAQADAGDEAPNPTSVHHEMDMEFSKSYKASSNTVREKSSSTSRYSVSTVSRLTGGIVDAQGTKTTFR